MEPLDCIADMRERTAALTNQTRSEISARVANLHLELAASAIKLIKPGEFLLHSGIDNAI